MTFPKHSRSLIALAAATTLVLAGCGGGGGDEGTPTSPSGGGLGGGTASTMDATSYAAVAEPVAQSVMTASSAASLPLTLLDDSASAGVSTALGLPAWTRRVAAMAAGGQNRARALAVQSSTSACSGGGSLAVTANVANNNGQLSANDSVTLTASSCVIDGVTLNGGVSIHLDAYTLQPGQQQGQAAISMTFQKFTSNGVTLDGGVTLDLTLAGGGETVNLVYKGATVTSASQTVKLNYAVAFSLASNGGGSSSLNGTVQIGSAGYTLKQQQDFHLNSQDLLPDSGRLTITDAGAARVDVTAGAQFFTYDFYKAGNTGTTPDATQQGAKIR